MAVLIAANSAFEAEKIDPVLRRTLPVPVYDIGPIGAAIDRVTMLLTIASVAWLIVQAAYAVTDVVLDRLAGVDGEQNRRARRTVTQITLVRRVAAAAVVVIAMATMLFTFPEVRAIGTGLLASAGLAGAIVGIAAQSTIGNLLAGLQLAFSDALRLDDVVVVNGDRGIVEELTLTYVSVRCWDERRLVYPVSYFTKNPFENWTRHGSQMIGTVVIHADWTVPVAEIRAELHRYLRGHPHWDGREWTLQVADVLSNGVVQLRAQMSAADCGLLGDLCSDTREHLVTYLCATYPQTLPRLRLNPPETDPNPARPDPDSPPAGPDSAPDTKQPGPAAAVEEPGPTRR